MGAAASIPSENKMVGRVTVLDAGTNIGVSMAQKKAFCRDRDTGLIIFLIQWDPIKGFRLFIAAEMAATTEVNEFLLLASRTEVPIDETVDNDGLSITFNGSRIVSFNKQWGAKIKITVGKGTAQESKFWYVAQGDTFRVSNSNPPRVNNPAFEHIVDL